MQSMNYRGNAFQFCVSNKTQLTTSLKATEEAERYDKCNTEKENSIKPED